VGADDVSTHYSSGRRRLIRWAVVVLGINALNCLVAYPLLIGAVGVGWATAEVIAVLITLYVVLRTILMQVRGQMGTSTALYCPPGGAPRYVTVDDDGSGLSALRFASALTLPFAESEQDREVPQYESMTRCPGCGQLDTHLATVCTLITRECLVCGHTWQERLT